MFVIPGTQTVRWRPYFSVWYNRRRFLAWCLSSATIIQGRISLSQVCQTNWQDILELLFTKKGHPWIFFLRALGTRVSTQVHVAYYFVSFDGGPWILRWAPDSKLTLPFSLWKSLLQNSSACDCFMILLLLSISFVT